MCWLSQIFLYWRGTITYRIMINASPNHKGRLMFSWDAIETGNGPTTVETNTQFTRVIDIAEERDVSITVGWGSELPALGCIALEAGSDSPLLENAIPDVDNGKIALRVLNPIVGPGPIPEPIQVAIFVKSDSMSFYNPTAYFDKLWFTPQSGEGDHAKALEEGTDEPSKPRHTRAAAILGAPSVSPDANDSIVAGETVRSLRTLMKRYCAAEGQVYQVDPANTDSIMNQVELTRNSIPAHAGISHFGAQDTEMIHLTYFMPCFAGWRGSVRVKAVTTGPRRGALHQVERFTLGTYSPYGPAVNVYPMSNGDVASGSNAGTLIGSAGVTMQPVDQCPIVSAELPYYFYERFASARTTKALFTPSAYQYTLYTPGTDVATFTQFFYAAGEDFSLFFFTGVPGMLFSA
jgi:hypothetical protein